MDMERFFRPVDPQEKVPYESQIALWAYRKRKHDESFEEFVMSETLVEKFNRGLRDPQKAAELRQVLEAEEDTVEALLNAFRTAPWTVVKPVVWNNNLNNPYFIKNLTLSHRFEIYIDEQFKAQGLDIGLYYGRDQQYSGENAAGIEIKRDMKLRETGNIYIEYAEKHYAGQQYQWVDSGILKQDNTRFFLIGDIDGYYVLLKSSLLELLQRLKSTPPRPVPAGVRLVGAGRGTSLGFIIPARVAQGMQASIGEVAQYCERL